VVLKVCVIVFKFLILKIVAQSFSICLMDQLSATKMSSTTKCGNLFNFSYYPDHMTEKRLEVF
jgi:hypothetical protein